MDRNDFIPEVLKSMDMCNFAPGSEQLVDITFINHPGSFFIRPVALGSRVELLEVTGEPITPEKIQVRKRVIYKSKTQKKYVRGDILAINLKDGKIVCSINAIDYGCIDHAVRMKYINLPEPGSMADCPPMTIHCALDFCHPKGDTFHQDATETMKFFIGKYHARMTVLSKTRDKLIVELKPFECPDNLSSLLAYMGCTQLTGATSAVNRFDTPNIAEVLMYKTKDVKVGDRFHVRVQSGDSLSSFYVAEINDYKKYTHEIRTFTEYCKKQLQEHVNVATDGRCVAVKLGLPSKYERGIVQAVGEDDMCVVKLIDWGKEVETNKDNVRNVSKAVYTELPAIAIHCSTEDEPWNNGLPKFLYLGYQFIIEIIEKASGDYPHKVKIFKTSEFH